MFPAVNSFRRRFSSRRGFSLVVSLVMMALMLLVAITLVSFVYVQSKLTEGRLKRAQAQLNAISGMRMALGQLQLLSGDDQRVTATADIFGGNDNASLPSGKAVDGKRFWTGVWATGGLDKSKIRDWSVYSPNKKPFLGWLVSDYNSTKEVFSPLELPLNRESAAGNTGKTLLGSAQKAFDADDEKLDLITLVGAGTLGSDRDAADTLSLKQREVRVRRVPIMRFSASSNELLRANSGSFAYWVGDEGVKAKVNIPDGTNEKFLKNDWERLFASTTASRVGVPAITGLEDFEKWWQRDIANADSAEKTTLRHIHDIEALPVYAQAVGGGNATQVKGYAQKLFHDVSFVSQGIFTDTYNGGLKTDLSLAFEMPWFSGDSWEKGFRDLDQFHGSGEKNVLNFNMTNVQSAKNERTEWWVEQPEDGLGYLFEIATGEGGSRQGRPHQEYLRGPTWDLVRNYYRLYKREDETVGFRGFKAHNKDAWISVGSVPYTYLSPIGAQVLGTSGGGGPLGKKANIGLMGTSNYNDDWDLAALLTEFDGTERTWKDGQRAPLIIPQSMIIAPVVQRIAFRYAFGIGTDKRLRILVDPVITVHNPYNVPLEFFGLGMIWTKYQPFDVTLTRQDVGEDSTEGTARNWPGTQSSVFYTNRLFSQGTRFTYRVYAGTTSLNKGASGYEILAPGEVRTYLPASAVSDGINQGITTRQLGSYKSSDWNPSRTGLVSSQIVQDSNGAQLAAFSDKEIASGIAFECKVNPHDTARSGDTNTFPREPDIFSFNLFYPVSANGDNMENRPESVQRIWNHGQGPCDYSDENLTGFIAMRRWHPSDGSFTVNKTIQLSGVGEKEYAMFMDIYRQGSNETPLAGPLVTNARAEAIFPYSFDKNMSDRPVDVGWKREIDSEDGMAWPSRFLTSRWGDDYGVSGQANIVLFEIPQRPLLSLGQLQHVNCSRLDAQPAYVIANSYVPVGISDRTALFSWSGNDFVNSGAAQIDTSEQEVQPRSDMSFAANLNLFDRYFFSGVNFAGTIGEKLQNQEKNIDSFVEKVFDTSADSPFPNKRISLIRDFGERKETEVKKDFKNPEKIARDLIFNGTFNVNSTSVEAWKAVLSGLRNQLLNLDGTFETKTEAAVMRFMRAVGSKLGGYSAPVRQPEKDGDGDDGNGWRWYIKNYDVSALAESMVEQVRARGPFMSMGDFVNRRLVSGEQGIAGALQAAIDDAGINKEFDGASNKDPQRYKNLYPGNGKISKKAGAPGYMTQGDLLSNIGAGLSARSDTFTIRAYGDVFGVTGTPEARAWCEAVVQRMPEFFSPQDDEEETMIDSITFLKNYRKSQPEGLPTNHVLEKWTRNDKLSAINKLFGRRYKIVSFRWLSQDEI